MIKTPAARACHSMSLRRRFVAGLVLLLALSSALTSGAPFAEAASSGKESTTNTASTTFAGPTTTQPVGVGRVVINGTGFGHGVGLAQDGALWMGKNGKSADQILKLFFPGTTFGSQGGIVRVPLASVGSLTVSLPQGGTVGDLAVPPGGQLRVASGSGVVTVFRVVAPTPSSSPRSSTVSTLALAEVQSDRHLSGIVAALPGIMPLVARLIAVTPPLSPATPTTPPAPAPALVPVPVEPTVSPPELVVPTTIAELEPTTVPPAVVTTIVPASTVPSVSTTTKSGAAEGLVSGATVSVQVNAGGFVLANGKKYRGRLDFIAAATGMRVVNELDVEQYLRAMGEVLDPRWPKAALQSQAIVARTYALRMMAARGEVCPTQRCQVYLGAQAEYAAMDAAVASTSGKVVLYKGQLAATFYSASGGGTIADPSEVFGPGTPIPYLKAGTYPIDDPKPWRVELGLAELGRRFGYSGSLYDVQVSQRGPSGRATVVSLIGSTGTRAIEGPKFDATLGLRSTNFTITVGRSSGSGSSGSGSSGSGVRGSETVDSPFALTFDSPTAFQSGLFDDEPLTPQWASPDGFQVAISSAQPSVPPSVLPSVLPRSVATEVLVTTLVPVIASPPGTDSDEESVRGSSDVSAAMAVGGEPTPFQIPPWASWAGFGSVGAGSLWLALRWALRSER
jgi:SpoIID/LytB domain protein